MGIMSIYRDLAEFGLRDYIGSLAGWDFEPFRIQFRGVFHSGRVDFNGRLYMNEQQFPAVTGKLSIWPYIGEDRTARHFDVTGVIRDQECGEKTITEKGENQGDWYWTKTWFDFKFSEVKGIDKSTSYANVIEIDDNDV